MRMCLVEVFKRSRVGALDARVCLSGALTFRECFPAGDGWDEGVVVGWPYSLGLSCVSVRCP